jgi:RNA polymerase sigma-70 factor, ECF subfamily
VSTLREGKREAFTPILTPRLAAVTLDPQANPAVRIPGEPPPDAPEPFVDPAAVARGEPAAIEALYRELHEPVYAFVYWRVGGVRQDAEDVTQETFVTALASIHRFEGRSTLHTWICGIAKNLAFARMRGRTHDRPGVPADHPEERALSGPHQHLERAETDRLVGLALTELPPHYQRALLDKYVQHRSFAEMATAQRCSAKAVESTVQRAKRALAAAFERVGLRRPDGEDRE